MSGESRGYLIAGRQELNLRCKQRRKFIATTNSRYDLPVTDSLLEERFEPTRPNEAWVTDIGQAVKVE